MSKQLTKAQVKELFFERITLLIDHWERATLHNTVREKLEGLMFSFLAEIDGESETLPAFILAPLPHEDDKKYKIARGEDWWPENHNSIVNCDFAGRLHDEFSKYRKA